MSGLDVEKRPLASQALEIDAVAADWIERRDFGPWSTGDQQALGAWLETSLSHRIAFVRIEAGWGKTGRLAILQPLQAHKATQSSTGIQGWLSTLKLAAATVFVAAVAVAAVLYASRPASRAYATNVGEREVLSLADGSQIELNTDTVLRTVVSAAQRTVWLEKGEAYFRVKHDPAHPFIVIAGNGRVTDVGTEFTVRKDSDRLQVAVVQGVVMFDDELQINSKKQHFLKRGDVIVATNNAIAVSRKTEHELSNELGWRRGVLVFDRTPLLEAAKEINRYNSKKLIIADDISARMKIGGTFPKNNVNAITAAASELFGLHVEDRGEEIVISHQ